MTCSKRNNNLVGVRLLLEVTWNARMANCAVVACTDHFAYRLRRQRAGLDKRAVRERITRPDHAVHALHALHAVHALHAGPNQRQWQRR